MRQIGQIGTGEAIFKDAMATAAAIDRLVHHSVILELNLTSYGTVLFGVGRCRTEKSFSHSFAPMSTDQEWISAQDGL